MAVKLRTEDGYYSRMLEIDGSKFYIRDLGEYYDEFLDRNAALVKSSGAQVEGRDMAEVLGELVARAAEPEQQKALRHELEALFAWLLGVGLVRWDLSADCDEETKCLLPARVQSELGRAIVQESDLTLQEGEFLDRLGAGLAARRR